MTMSETQRAYRNPITYFRDRIGTTLCAHEVARSFADIGKAPKIVLLVGIPASGKSTLARELEALDFFRLSRDRIRAELTGDESDHNHEDDVTQCFNEQLLAALVARRNIVGDTTNVTAAHRQSMLRPAGKHGYNSRYLIHFDLPLRICQERNLHRQRNVPPEVISEMHIKLHHGGGYPEPAEGQLLKLRPSTSGQYRIKMVRY